MFSKTFCCCCKTLNNKQETPASSDVPTGGINNTSFETWEPYPQSNSLKNAVEVQPKLSNVAVVEHQPKLSRSSRSSFESIKLSKIDLNLDLFEDNDRFADISEIIHKSNSDLDKI